MYLFLRIGLMMREEYEFRVHANLASSYLNDNEGKNYGSLRRVVTHPGEQLFEKIELATKAENSMGRPFYGFWNITRQYSPQEINSAEIFHFWPSGGIQINEDDVNSSYNESASCSCCKAGAEQISPLQIKWAQKKSKREFLRLLGGELILSSRAMNIFLKANIQGVDFFDIFGAAGNRKKKYLNWRQMIPTNTKAELNTHTKAGDYPFKESREIKYLCGQKHIYGLNLLSDVHISRSSWEGADIAASSKFIGVRMGLIRPKRILLCSPRFREVVLENDIKGFNFEVAHLE
jgi:hypothetical protein